MSYDLGDAVALSFTAFDVNGAAAAAAAVTLTIALPDGTSATPTIEYPSPGNYQAYYLTTQPGRHTYRWLATGTPGPGVGVGSFPDSFDVTPALSGTILSLIDCHDELNIPVANTTFDSRIRGCNAAVTGIVEKLCGPVVVRTITERYLESGESEIIMLRKVPIYQPATQPYPIVAITPVLTYGLTYDLSLLTVDPLLGTLRHTAGLPFWNGPYDITYTCGRPIVPDNILEGTRIILRHLWSLYRGGSGANSQGYAADDTTMIMGYAVPNRALEVLDAPGSRDPGGIA